MRMADEILSRDAQKLAELGYKQELTRGWSQFSNFAISFTIISVLAGCFTTYPQAWNLGGPIAISWGWPMLGLIAIVATVDWFCAQFFVFVFNLWSLDLGVINFADMGPNAGDELPEIFAVFVVILLLHALINIYS